MLRSIEENKRIRALVIDIDSPGGGAGASEYMYRAIAAHRDEEACRGVRQRPGRLGRVHGGLRRRRR